jgi:hypothetical protein
MRRSRGALGDASGLPSEESRSHVFRDHLDYGPPCRHRAQAHSRLPHLYGLERVLHLLLGDSDFLTWRTTIPLFYVGGVTRSYAAFCLNPFHPSLVIGLFGLLGMSGVFITPFVGRFIDRLVPWYATLFATLVLLAVQGTYIGAAGINVAAVIIATVGLDLGLQMQQVSITTAVFG